MTDRAAEYPRLPVLDEGERAWFSVNGFMRFDAAAVANELRNRTLHPSVYKNFVEQLALMIERRHPQGLKLVLQGQGKGGKLLYEKAKALDRMVAVGELVETSLEAGSTVEEAVIDAAEALEISEPTVFRDLSLYRLYRTINGSNP